LIVELGGLTPGSEYDVLDVSGLATLGGIMEVHLVNGFRPGPADTFSLLRASDVIGRFDDVRIFGGTADVSYAGGFVQLSDFRIVPEPSTLLLAMIGLSGMCMYVARHKRGILRIQ
ncbi:MAG: PEP-CTERM sorting domain-containing protein, partial [Pirellulaceae bacterium]|nr:PEP-CTERM sorting domain-containing protein [Pirellulaceae bacterium]